MKTPFLLAPMAELSHRALRELIEGFGGCDCYFSEMISAGALLADGPFEKWYTDPGPVPEKLVFQVVGSDSGQISKAAAILDKLDYAGIDINMGCSAPLIRKTGAGAAWMADIDRAGELISRVRAAVKRRLSVKLRIGFKDDFDYLVRFCRRLEAEGTELITLHPRLVTEKFKRTARWDYVSALRRELKIPVAGNGDIADAETLLRQAETCDAVMVGRAAVRQPWIFAQGRALSSQASSVPTAGALSLGETGVRFLEFLARYQPPEFHLSRARRFFSFFCDNLKWGNYVKNLINREETLAGIERVFLEGVTMPENTN
jgi:tRNA-dihydrouridine synthase